MTEFFKSLGPIVFAGSVERVFKKALKIKSQRLQQLWLGLSSLGFASGFLICLLLPIFPERMRPLLFIRQGGETNWIFWLSENNWIGLSIGLLIGILLRLIGRYSGFLFLVAAGGLLASVISMAAGWGIFLGGFLIGALENFWKFPLKEFRLRSGLALAFGLGGLVLAPLWISLVAQLTSSGYSPQLRWLQWILCVFTFLVVETITSLLFFHFYYAQMSKLTKV